ncbi:hypothetical protein [Rheinheimera nanhaiensis]|uniref:Uncharacterized protein n=1 Tax=Rheinheimera nanhaiensis E407-8 TaxID=562729 RepID=I1E2Q4_9GAMM|nr:hypothetical protein [Rheinheimera nanhaiensis]GAB60582.1 hypothetical protein RNAN_3608 [Rheinheimera nanhaiensis E407-8]
MLIATLLKTKQQQVKALAEQSSEQQKLLGAYQFLLKQNTLHFLSSAPGLALSFSAGVLFQLRHHSHVKTLRSLIRWRRLTGLW